MNLKFSVLFYDDNQDWFDSLDMEALKATVLGWGMTLDIDYVHEAAEFEKRHERFGDYDLIVIDFNLETTDTGDAFIGRVRASDVLTEVIFYSADPVRRLRERVLENELDGVYVGNRTQVIPLLERVGRHTVRKVLDLENMRGLVMSETGSLDILLDEIFTLGFNKVSGVEQDKIVDKFLQGRKAQLSSFADELEQLTKERTPDGVLAACDSNKRWENFRRIQKALKLTVRIEKYKEEVLDKRNVLAHGVPSRDGDVYVFTYRGREERFGEAENLKLRSSLLEFRRLFVAAIEEINGLPPASES